MIPHTNWEGQESEQKGLAQVELFTTFLAWQRQGKND